VKDNTQQDLPLCPSHQADRLGDITADTAWRLATGVYIAAAIDVISSLYEAISTLESRLISIIINRKIHT
jgi:hypothetical protein